MTLGPLPSFSLGDGQEDAGVEILRRLEPVLDLGGARIEFGNLLQPFSDGALA